MGGMSLGDPSSAVQKMCEEHMNYKSHLHKTCVSMCERVWNTKCIWKVWLEVLLRFQRVNVGVLLRLHAQQLPVCSPCAHSCYLWRTSDKHIRMYSCRLRLCSQNCTISFSATGSLLKRLWEVVICIHQEKMQSIKKSSTGSFTSLIESIFINISKLASNSYHHKH